jgi:hypothetical protein
MTVHRIKILEENLLKPNYLEDSANLQKVDYPKLLEGPEVLKFTTTHTYKFNINNKSQII